MIKYNSSCYSTDTRPLWLKATETILMAVSVRLALAGQRMLRLRTLSVDALELAFALLEVVTGTAFLEPAMALLHTPSAAAIATKLPPATRAYVLLPAGLVTLIGYADDQTRWRRAGRLAGTFYWLYAGALSFIQSPANYVAYCYLLFAFYDYWAYSRAGVSDLLRQYSEKTVRTRTQIAASEITRIALGREST
jgi:hypothetical protein